jgi:diguanylate cyclase (GGDEF)-like protein
MWTSKMRGSSSDFIPRTRACITRTNHFLRLAIVLFGAFTPFSGNAFGQTQAASTPLTVTRAGDLHELARALAKNANVHLIATVTYYDPADGVLFVQDASGGVYVNTDKAYPIKQGDLVEITGKGNPSYRSEVATDPAIQVIGHGQKFVPVSYGLHELLSGLGDCELVAIRGKVLAANIEQHENAPSGHLDIAMPGGDVQVYLGLSAGFNPDSLLDSTVEVTGVAGGAFDAKNQINGINLFASDPGMIRVIKRPAIRADQLPFTDIDHVVETRDVTDSSQRVRVRGTVTYYKAGDSAVIENNGKSIYVQTRQTSDLAVGDIVDAFGFASDREYAPSLRDASIVKTGGRGSVSPHAVNYLEALSGFYSDNLVSMTGVLVAELHDGRSDTLVIDTGGHLVNGYLDGKGSLPNFLLGSRIQIVGVCRILPGGPWRGPSFFSLQMRSAEDAQLVSQPSWWTVAHLSEILGALLLLAMAITAWAVILRRRVIHQTARIERSMMLARERSRILEKISSNHAADVLLTRICASVMSLMPGVSCTYYFDSDRKSQSREQLFEGSLFKMTLIGANDRACGGIIVSAPRDHQIPNDQGEVYAMLSEMATLAMRQSLLHQSLVHHSTHDSLTELPNRRLCEMKLASSLEEAQQHGTRLAVIYIDVNRFKRINDRYGHKVGDLYLRQISARLQAHIRATDLLARIGGDEFLVIAPLANGQDYVETLTARLKACFDDPFILDEHTIEGSASFGLASYPQDGTTAEELQRKADHAMYLFKRNAAADSDVTQGMAIITPAELELALSKDQFRLVYQPQFSANGVLTGLEALIRLEDPILGILSPDAFISVAERHDVILGMGAWVLKRALQDAVHWQLQTGAEMVMVVNVSARELNEPDFAERVFAALTQYHYPAERLELELTERSLVSDSDNAARQLRRLRQAGVRISLDDFGTGQSSLSLLHKLPIDTIKLDRSFIVAMDDEPQVLPIIQAISFMALRLGKRIVAEGIEHTGPVPALMEMGKIEFQGYLLSRPLSFSDVDSKIKGWRKGILMPEAFRESNSRRPE